MGNVKEVCFDNVEKPSKEFTKNEKEIKIFLETEMSEELKKEALLREVQRKIQSLRKKNGLVVEDKIDVLIDKSIQDKLKEFEEELKKNVGAKKIEYTKVDEDSFKFMDKEIGITIVVK
jgi:isoleucyl-tRNA synthetase